MISLVLFKKTLSSRNVVILGEIRWKQNTPVTIVKQNKSLIIYAFLQLWMSLFANKDQDLCLKFHDNAQSFVLSLYTIHELRNQKIFIG